MLYSQFVQHAIKQSKSLLYFFQLVQPSPFIQRPVLNATQMLTAPQEQILRRCFEKENEEKERNQLCKMYDNQLFCFSSTIAFCSSAFSIVTMVAGEAIKGSTSSPFSTDTAASTPRYPTS